MQDPLESHLKVAKKIVHYIKGTYQLGIKYCSDKVNQLFGYIELDWAIDGDDVNNQFPE
jgi:hypothetical protein